jgi:hypothetical protein
MNVTTLEQLYQTHIKPISFLEQLQLLALISQRLALLQVKPRKVSKAEWKAFFQPCDSREGGTEPEWEEHLAVIQKSKSMGQSWN